MNSFDGKSKNKFCKTNDSGFIETKRFRSLGNRFHTFGAANCQVLFSLLLLVPSILSLRSVSFIHQAWFTLHWVVCVAKVVQKDPQHHWGGGGSSIAKVTGNVPPARVYIFQLLV